MKFLNRKIRSEKPAQTEDVQTIVHREIEIFVERSERRFRGEVVAQHESRAQRYPSPKFVFTLARESKFRPSLKGRVGKTDECFT